MEQPFPAILGIRHHGPGSARSVCQALEALKPDILLVEGPPDAAEVLPLALHPDMTPPVALLVYVPDEPRRAVYYPFAVFSPEWQAIRYGLTHNIPVRFMDLPQAHQLAIEESILPASEPSDKEPNEEPPKIRLREDPLTWVAEAAGHTDSERWWEQLVEQRQDSTDLFKAILELMGSLREEASKETEVPPNIWEVRREAYMRQTLRTARKEGFQRIAVVCGAWHAPALATLPPAKEDVTVLKGLPKVKVVSTWVPWTYSRLTYRSGYGAGIQSPGYYAHLWSEPDSVSLRWLTLTAHLLREQGLDVSTASVIEGVRLAETLAALRDRSVPGLSEFHEAIRSVFCFGDETPMRLIQEKLIIGELLGEVPEETPSLPLQRDLQQSQKRLRLAPQASRITLDLDLRKPVDLDRSYLFHRLSLLNIPWGVLSRSADRGKGTFHEIWILQWQPEFAIFVIEANVWGNTIPDAATGYACHLANHSEELSILTGLVEQVLLADLPHAVSHVMTRLQNMAALTSDIPHLMDALPSLTGILRYGNVRRTDTEMVRHVVDGLVKRICVGLTAACSSLNDEAAEEMFNRLMGVHNALVTLRNEEHLDEWHDTLHRMVEQQSLHGLLAGRCCRLLFDQYGLPSEEVAQRMHLALSTAGDLQQAAVWIEGFLRHSGLILLHNEALWEILDGWVRSIKDEAFTQLLPLLRRTFSTFTVAERRQIGERVKQGAGIRIKTDSGKRTAFDEARANKVLPLMARLLGLPMETKEK